MINFLIRWPGKWLGLRFAADNHVTPVLRLDRFRRLAGPGFFVINPLIESTLPPVNLGLRVSNFVLQNVLSRDNIPFEMALTILYRLDPALPPTAVLAQVVRLPVATLADVVADYASQGLRRLAARHNADLLCGSDTLAGIEQDLANWLRAQLRVLGLAPLRRGGVLIKETIAPERFTRAMLDAKQHQSTLRVLGSFREGQLIEQAIRAQFLNGLASGGGQVTLFSGLEGAPGVAPGWPMAAWLQKLDKNGR